MWQTEAACRDIDPVYFESRETEEQLAAASVCLNCPVIDLCFDTAKREDKHWTVRGGSIPSANGGYHGRPDGYKKHRELGTEVCAECDRARRIAYQAVRYRKLARDRRKR